ncbi:MAG: ADP-ribosylation factor-like protein [Actinobacteria bacterium]|nr:ADP-ribosylation factor-like protein [Actinomycetota bacterium]
MALINLAAGEINYKIVYYGCALGGKTTSIQYVYKKITPQVKGKLVSIATEEERTLYFDFLPLTLDKVRGLKTRFHLYTVPGQPQYNASRKLVIQGVDGIVFVADSQIDRLDDNVEAYLNMWDNLADQGDSPLDLGLVMQYNKRDLTGVFPSEDLNDLLNQTDSAWVESCALTGEGVFEALRNVTKQVIARTNAAAEGMVPDPSRA